MPLSWMLVAVLGLGGAADLSAAGRLSARPAVCVETGSVWSRAGNIALRRDCAALARGYARLSERPAAAAAIAVSLLESQVAIDARVLLGRAELAQGNATEAWQHFELVRRASAAHLHSPHALRDTAVAASFTGHYEQAASLYRSLVSQWAFLPAPDRSSALLEAAMAVMRLGPEHVPEARRYVELASREHEYRGSMRYVVLLNALALARSGRPPSKMPEIDAESWQRAHAAGPTRPGVPRLPAGEVAALLAVASERVDAEAAVDAWRVYGASPSAVNWLGWSAARIDALGRTDD